MSESPRPDASEPTTTTERRRREFPHVLVVLVALGLLAAILSYLVPAGLYDRVPGPDGREVVDPDSFRRVDADPVSAMQLLTAFPRGLIDAGQIVFFVFTVGGMFEVVRRTGLIDTVLSWVARVFANRGALVIPALMVPFSLVASFIGVPELSLVYIPAILPLMLALGYDRIVAAAVALLGTGAGFAAGFLNPINTGLGQQITGLEPFSGIGLRIVLYVVLITTACLYVTWYARRVAKDPSRSLLTAEQRADGKDVVLDTTQHHAFTGRQVAAGIAFLALAGLLIWGIIAQGWFFPEMAGMWIVIALVVGLVGGLRPSEVANGFEQGMRDVLSGAIVVGVARGVAILLEDGQILDSIVHGLEVVGVLPPVLFVVGMFVVQAFFNLIVPSGSGQALVTLPVLGPLSDILGVSRQSAVLAYQLGDGLTNVVYPMSGYFMASLVVARVPYNKWLRFYAPLLGIWALVAVGFLVYAQLTGWS
ncbi:YfcC family protein [Georgenia sp. Z1344]|uniref:YfcC family protein n=1 Tax=Georgenia sp. Z1344 TaxID=3416706 RepID=UPI003CE7B659